MIWFVLFMRLHTFHVETVPCDYGYTGCVELAADLRDIYRDDPGRFIFPFVVPGLFDLSALEE